MAATPDDDAAVSSCEHILSDNAAEWQPALDHDFLRGCCEGSVPADAFNRWLRQDQLFVVEFAEFAAHVLAAAPKADRQLLRDGVAALDSELAWFQEKLAERGLAGGGVPPHEVTAAYTELLRQLRGKPYVVLITTFFAIEYVYNQAWANILPSCTPPYDEFARQWGSEGFGQYVEQLRAVADRALELAQPEELQEAKELAGKVVPRLEARFWQMALAS